MGGDDQTLASAMIFEVMNAELPNYKKQLGKAKALIVFHIKVKGKQAATYSKTLLPIPNVYPIQPLISAIPREQSTKESRRTAADQKP